jgi:hypothetical protein
MTVQEYLTSRAAETLKGRANLTTAVPLLAAAGQEADGLLVRAEGVKALATRTEVQQIAETVQTLAALSREIWTAHAAAIAACAAYAQLQDVEAQLEANLAP